MGQKKRSKKGRFMYNVCLHYQSRLIFLGTINMVLYEFIHIRKIIDKPRNTVE